MTLTLEELEEMERKSEEDTRKKLEKLYKVEIENFDVRTNGSLGVMPKKEEEYIFKQQGRRVSWMKKNDRFCSARHYANADCARKIIDELIRLGYTNAFKEKNEEQTTLF